MKASIEGEDSEGCGLEVVDNNDVEHWVEIKYGSSEISFHEQEGYPDDPSERTPEQSERVHQTRKFARYYVYLERGYDTVQPEIHPERIDAVRTAIAALEDTQLQNLFGELYQQLASHQGDAESVLDLPADAASPTTVLYRQHVYLDIDPRQTALADQARDLADQYDIDLSGQANPQESDVDAWQAFTDEFSDLAAHTGTDLSDGLFIEGVSSLYLAYLDEAGHEHIGEPDQDHAERDPDTLLELPPRDVTTLADFRAYLRQNLCCQIRDCFVRMGLTPPEPFQRRGYGRFEAAERYEKLDMYPNYLDSEGPLAF